MSRRGRAASRLRRALVLLGGVALLSAADAGRGAAALSFEYPEWFIRTPVVHGVRFAVGLSPAYGSVETSMKVAREHATSSLQAARGVRIRAEYLQEILASGNVAYRGEAYAEDTLTAPEPEGVVADSVFLPRMVMVLMASDSLALAFRRVRPATRAPRWTEHIPVSNEGQYSVGMANSHFNEYDSWKEAERQARRSIAFSSLTQMRSRVESQTGGASRGALVASTVTELRDIEVRERWRDQRRMYVLIHARVVSGQ